MKKTLLLLISLLSVLPTLPAASIQERRFTEIVKDVKIQNGEATAPADQNAVLGTPGAVRTGPESRVELKTADSLLTRLGANSEVAFEAEAPVLRQGSLLVAAPRGKATIAVPDGSANATVSGTTFIVATAPNGGFKVIVLAGEGRVKRAKGRSLKLRAGEMVLVLPKQTPTHVVALNLEKLVAGSLLVNGFKAPLPALKTIHEAVARQQKLLARGRAEDTGWTPEKFALAQSQWTGNGLNALDNGVFDGFGAPFINPYQLMFYIPGLPGGPGGGPGGSPILDLAWWGGGGRYPIYSESQLVLIEINRNFHGSQPIYGPQPPLPPVISSGADTIIFYHPPVRYDD